MPARSPLFYSRPNQGNPEQTSCARAHLITPGGDASWFDREEHRVHPVAKGVTQTEVCPFLSKIWIFIKHKKHLPKLTRNVLATAT